MRCVGEAGGAFDHAHAKAGEALAGIVRRDGGDHLAHMVMDRAEMDAGALRLDAELGAVRESIGPIGRRNQRLRRHASSVEAFAAQLALFDQHDRNAERSRRRGDGQAARAGADHADVRFEHCAMRQPARAGGLAARAQVAHQHRQQRKRAKRGEGCDQLRRQHGHGVEIAAGMARCRPRRRHCRSSPPPISALSRPTPMKA